MPPDHAKLDEIYKLTLENNRLLHKMRRSAMWGRIISWVIYIAFFLAPIWFYYAYLNDTVQGMLKAYDHMQGSGQNAPGAYQQIQQAIQELRSKFPNTQNSSSSAATSS